MPVLKRIKDTFLSHVLFFFMLLALIFPRFVSIAGEELRQGTDRCSSQLLHNGIYAVLQEASTPEKAQCPGLASRILRYDKKYTDSGPDEPVKYVAIDTSSYVPLILEGTPDTKKDDKGMTVLLGTIRKEHEKTLENFTRAHLGGEIATVVDGEIVTLHKVRSVIMGGKFQITRCTDNACEVLKDKLTR